MEKGFKKFLGFMAVCSILGGSAGIGVSACPRPEVMTERVSEGPVLTCFEVRKMDAVADFFFLLKEIVSTDYSQWDKFLGRMLGLAEVLKGFSGKVWEKNCFKKEKWKRAAAIEEELGKIIRSDVELESKLCKWLDKVDALLKQCSSKADII